MGLLGDSYTLFIREMLIFKKNIWISVARSALFPIIFIFLLGSLGAAPKNVPVAVINNDNGAASISFINMLQSAGAINVESATNQQAAMNLLGQGDVVAVVVIPNGFSSFTGSTPNIFVYVDESSSSESAVATSVINSAASHFNLQILTTAASPQGLSSGISVLTNYVYGATSNTKSFVISGILVMVATFGSIFGGGFTVIMDRELGNLKAFLVTPINKFSVMFSKVLYGTFQSVFGAYIALAVGLLYGASITSGAIGFLEIVWFVFLSGLGFSGLAIALASRMKQIQTYGLIAQVVTLPLSFLAGALVPTSSLPSFLHPFIVVNPMTYAVNAVRDIMVKGFMPASMFVLDSTVLILFAAATLTLSVILFRNASE